jgi:tRNA threonylcarbamoyladenosine biosynthesis protein TsaB
MKILALEFSSEQRSAAIWNADDPSASAFVSEKGGRSTRAIALIEQALQQASLTRDQIDCLAIGLGPGSYTGMRAGIALAQGWQLARNIKTIGISSVECLAAQAQSDKISGRVNIVIDAQRNEFYRATYEISSERGQPVRELEALKLVTVAEIESRAKSGEIILGPDASRFPGGKILFPNAATLAQLAATRTDFIPAEKLEPIYLRETNFVKAPPPRIVS